MFLGRGGRGGIRVRRSSSIPVGKRLGVTTSVFPAKKWLPECDTTDTGRGVSNTGRVYRIEWRHGPMGPPASTGSAGAGALERLRTDPPEEPPKEKRDHKRVHKTQGAYRFRPDGKRFRLRVVVGRLATLKVDQASIAEAQFSLAA